MATETTNLKLNKPDKTDFYNIDLVNANMDKIDEAVSGKASKDDIPKSLPANGGNADSLGGKNASSYATKGLLIANGVSLFTYIESLTDEQLPPVSNVTIRAYNCSNTPYDGFPNKVDFSTYNGGDFIIDVTRLEQKDWYILTARESHTSRMFTCGKRGNVWGSWTVLGDIIILPDGTNLFDSSYLTDNDSWSIKTFRIGNSVTAPLSFGYDANNNDFYYTVYKMGNDWIKIEGRDVRSNREFTNSKLGGTWSNWVEKIQTTANGQLLVRRENRFYTQNHTHEGAQITMESASASTLGGNFNIDVYDNYFRFMGGVSNQGALLDIGRCGIGVADKIHTTKTVAVQSVTPSSPQTNDLWIW